MIQIKFTASGANSQLGGFSSGDIARVPEAFARHLVEEARVAAYIDGATAALPAATEQPPKTARRKKPAREQS